jgi:hypothetical protein
MYKAKRNAYPKECVVHCHEPPGPEEGQAEPEVIRISGLVRVNVSKIKGGFFLS